MHLQLHPIPAERITTQTPHNPLPLDPDLGAEMPGHSVVLGGLAVFECGIIGSWSVSWQEVIMIPRYWFLLMSSVLKCAVVWVMIDSYSVCRIGRAQQRLNRAS
jgi:hypothetical protein